MSDELKKQQMDDLFEKMLHQKRSSKKNKQPCTRCALGFLLGIEMRRLGVFRRKMFVVDYPSRAHRLFFASTFLLLYHPFFNVRKISKKRFPEKQQISGQNKNREVMFCEQGVQQLTTSRAVARVSQTPKYQNVTCDYCWRQSPHTSCITRSL